MTQSERYLFYFSIYLIELIPRISMLYPNYVPICQYKIEYLTDQVHDFNNRLNLYRKPQKNT